MIQEQLEILNKLLIQKQTDVDWTKSRLVEQELELEMVKNRITLTEKLIAEEREVQ